MKDTQESWSRGNSSGLNRGVRGNNGTRNVGWSGQTQISYNGNVWVIVKCKQSCAYDLMNLLLILMLCQLM